MQLALIAASLIAAAHAQTACAPAYDPAKTYLNGDTASEGGVNYKANWWSQNSDPATNSGAASDYKQWTNLGACGSGPVTTVAKTTTTIPAIKASTTAVVKQTTTTSTTSTSTTTTTTTTTTNFNNYDHNGYWGQSSGYFTNGKYQNSLLSYCQTGHWDTIHLAFLATFSSSSPTTGFILDLDKNTYGVWDSTGGKAIDPKVAASFLQVGKDIQACQALGVKIGLSLGGALANIDLSAGSGPGIAAWLHNTFFGGNDPKAVRPFGAGVTLDGIDYDDEVSVPPVADIIAINTYLKTNNPGKMFITAAPQCPFPDYNIGGALAAANNGFDYVQVQFYNNAQCNLINPLFNFDQWVEQLGLPIYVGVPGSTPSASSGYATPAQVQAALKVITGDILKPWLWGVMTWDVSSAEASGFAPAISSILATL
ncbi:glycoside hydrolase [Rhizoclosmatium globosum]|uniref:Glycoside hydrolase n=1 Tax=Rhizoclosmatium globosum TaxID=329046 RepID=A0A1Y2BZV6_9FUNG|nr:glycoside hydrolase [Rhizoclosmatium globosum]|eukprot:ORY39595.1 glycoside hydrolase [Rhizoclosmatium globosum]